MSTENIAETAAPVTDNAAPNAEAISTETAKPAEVKTEAPVKEKAAVNTDEKAYRLKELIDITEKNPNKVLSAEDQAIYEEWVDKKIQPKERPEAKEKEVEKAEKPVEKVEKAPEKSEIPEHITAAMKEVGAKTPEELTAKIKELRQVVSGKETEAVKSAKAELTRAADSERALWRDFMDGKPEALAYVEKNYGLRPKAQPQQVQPQTDFDPEVLADADALTGGITSKVIAQNKALQDRLDALEGKFTGYEKTNQQQAINTQVSAQVVDEMLAVAGEIPELKDIPGLRNAIIDRVVNRKEDPRLDAFNDLFQIAQEAGTDLRNALLIKRGRDAAVLIERAREEGLKQAYNHTPNRSLSSIQVEDAQPQSITDTQLAAMERDPRAIPDSWMDKNGNLDKAKIPKKAWPIFGIE